MKTVFNRALSLVMCLLLVFSTVSVMTFGVSAEEEFNYKTYAQNVTKENVHHLMDMVDDGLKDANIKVEIDVGLKFVVDATSIDALCDTLDRFRGIITIGKGLLGDLKELNLKAFDKEMSRAKTGDYKIFCELIEFAAANSGIIEKFIAGNLDLGIIAGAVLENSGVDLSNLNIGGTIKGAIADLLFKDDPNHSAIKDRAIKDFDAFVYTDLIDFFTKQIGLFQGITVNANTTIDDLLKNMFTIFVNDYMVSIIKDYSFNFSSLGSAYKELDNIIKLQNYKGGIQLSSKSLLEQINNVLGTIFAQIVPGYKNWKSGGYTLIGDNMRGLVQYIAKEGLKINPAGKTDEQLMLSVVKVIIQSADPNAYNVIKNTTTLKAMADKIFIYWSGKTYPAGATYEHVLGDYFIDQLGGMIPLYDEVGKEITANGTKTVWEVMNSVFNFLLVDKNLDSYFGWNMHKGMSYFEKLDLILDYTAADGTADFSSEKYFKGLIDCAFRIDLQGFINATAVKAYNFAGKATVVKFLCNTVNNLVKNWSGRKALNSWSSFNDGLSDKNLANTLRIIVETINGRTDGAANCVGLFLGIVPGIKETVTVAGKTPTCTSNGYAPTKTCGKDGRKISDKSNVIYSDGHKTGSNKITKNPTCTATGTRTYYCSICKAAIKTATVAALGHKKTGWVVTKKATYKTTGEQKKTCTVCKATTDKQTIKMLTLGKPSGVKATAVSTSSVKVTWKKVTGAESYTLYYKTGSGKWKSVNAKNKTSYTVKKLKTGTTYSFRVVAVAGTNKSAYSSTVSGSTNPAAVSLKRADSKKKKEVVVEWKKISGVTGYEVMYSTSKKFTKKTTKTATVKKDKTVKTYLKKVKSKKTYYVKVRAYKTVNKVKIYGAYSKVKTVKCK